MHSMECSATIGHLLKNLKSDPPGIVFAWEFLGKIPDIEKLNNELELMYSEDALFVLKVRLLLYFVKNKSKIGLHEMIESFAIQINDEMSRDLCSFAQSAYALIGSKQGADRSGRWKSNLLSWGCRVI